MPAPWIAYGVALIRIQHTAKEPKRSRRRRPSRATIGVATSQSHALPLATTRGGGQPREEPEVDEQEELRELLRHLAEPQPAQVAPVVRQVEADSERRAHARETDAACEQPGGRAGEAMHREHDGHESGVR